MAEAGYHLIWAGCDGRKMQEVAERIKSSAGEPEGATGNTFNTVLSVAAILEMTTVSTADYFICVSNTANTFSRQIRVFYQFLMQRTELPMARASVMVLASVLLK